MIHDRLKHRFTVFIAALFSSSLASSSFALADDFPQWRGVNRDGVINENNLMQELPEGELPRKWSVPIGSGYSGPTVAKGKVYVTDRGIGESDNQVERILCFDEESGKQISRDWLTDVDWHKTKAFSLGLTGMFINRAARERDGIVTEGAEFKAVKAEIIDKAGSWFAYKDQKIGQGRENVKNFLRDNPSIAKEVESRILENAGIVEKAMMEGDVEPKNKSDKDKAEE